MLKTLIATALLAFAAPAFAQSTHHSGTDYKANMDHAGMNHADHDHAADPHAGHDMASGALTLARTAEIDAALLAGGEPVVVKVLGAVCDFCATAMNKTFGRRDDVMAVHVDLDAKTLNLVLEPGTELSDKALRKLVKKSGYKADTVARGADVTS